jgi:hypothetical protein
MMWSRWLLLVLPTLAHAQATTGGSLLNLDWRMSALVGLGASLVVTILFVKMSGGDGGIAGGAPEMKYAIVGFLVFWAVFTLVAKFLL